VTLSTRSGIPTTYRETNFRSRLEARWAAFFDLVGWHWIYEPFDANGWIPDFLIAGDAPFLVEVGPCATDADYRAKAAKPSAYADKPTLVVGVSPLVLVDPELRMTVAGLIVNEFPATIGPAFWETCRVGELGIYGDKVTRPCNHGWRAQSISNLEQLWAQAGNVVQWQRR
jgi:hypothetical protein